MGPALGLLLPGQAWRWRWVLALLLGLNWSLLPAFAEYRGGKKHAPCQAAQWLCNLELSAGPGKGSSHSPECLSPSHHCWELRRGQMLWGAPFPRLRRRFDTCRPSLPTRKQRAGLPAGLPTCPRWTEGPVHSPLETLGDAGLLAEP